MGDTDARLFKENDKGELFELREILNGKSDKDKIEAVKKIIFAMTNGMDVSKAFMDVVNNIQTKNTELKKLIYLYVMSYAKARPELAISVVNTFQKDSRNANPLIRALAIRTMASIRVETVVEHLCEPLARTLADEDAYVRKTAALAVAKLHDMNPTIAADHGFVDTLRGLLEDSNPMVVSNALVSLIEIQATSASAVLVLNTAILSKLLSALSECSEWGQVAIMDAVAQYAAVDPREAESVIDRVIPRLNHSNSAVTLAAVRVIVRFLEAVPQGDFVRATLKRVAQPLASLLNHTEKPHEIQFVALRSINLVVQRYPTLFATLQQVRLLFCNYNDPIYVKLEKVDILVRVATEANIDNLLVEFKTYAQEVDVEFVRKAVRAIGRCAIKLELATQRCVDVLLELIETKVNYVVQEAIVVIRDIFRKYPNRYEVVIGILCENLEELDEPEAKAAMIWIVGEYAERIENAAELLESFLETYQEEVVDVQLALLTAIVKLFLKRPAETQAMVHSMLNTVTQTAEDPDLRDRGFLYWRLLAADPEAAKSVVLAAKPLIADEAGRLESGLLTTLLGNIGTLSSVYFKPPEAFVVLTRLAADDADDDDYEPKAAAPRLDPARVAGPASAAAAPAAPAPAAPAAVAAAPVAHVAPASNLLDLGGGGGSAAGSGGGAAPRATGNLMDLLGGGGGGGGGGSSGGGGGAPAAPAGLIDMIGGGASAAAASAAAPAGPPAQPYSPPLSIVLTAATAGGMNVAVSLRRAGGNIAMALAFENKAAAPVSDIQVAFNKNSFGLVPAGPIALAPLAMNATAQTIMPIGVGAEMVLCDPLMNLQVAIKCSHGVYFFAVLVPFGVVLIESGRLERAELLSAWRAIPETQEVVIELALRPDAPLTARSLAATLEANNIFVIAEHAGKMSSQNLVFTSAKTTNGVTIMSEFTLHIDSTGRLAAVRVCTRAVVPAVVAPYNSFLAALFQ